MKIDNYPSDFSCDIAIELDGITTRFGKRLIHDNISLQINAGEVMGIVGGSGSGKSTLLKEMAGLLRPEKGTIKVLGQVVVTSSADKLDWLRKKTGFLFQGGALFSALTVLENIEAPLKIHARLSISLAKEIAELKLLLTGLKKEVGRLFPSQLSGGMVKRAALARAISLDPDILFLDEPTAGLDPVSAGLFDELILKLQKSLGLTVVMVTHDFDSLWRITDRVAVLGEKKILAVGNMKELSCSEHPVIKELFRGPRARAAQDFNKK